MLCTRCDAIRADAESACSSNVNVYYVCAMQHATLL